jgi:maltose O-acetyltransferase
VTIGRDCWIGGGPIILPRVTVGHGCVIAAGSDVTKAVPPGSAMAGVARGTDPSGRGYASGNND